MSEPAGIGAGEQELLDHVHATLVAAGLILPAEREAALLPLARGVLDDAAALRRESAGLVPAGAFDARWGISPVPTPPEASTPGEVASLIGRREMSPREVVEAALERIERLDPSFEAFVTVCADRALEEADRRTEELLAGRPIGPLHGVPVAIKDVFDVAGLPTACGSRVRAGHIAAADATAVRKLREAGAIVIGKTTTHEFAYGPVCEPTRNAWNPDHISGGSSGGSAVAVALGMAMVGLGTDTGGSIRCPSAYNGITGFKPTYGLISKAGAVPLSWSLDHVGFMTASVEEMPPVLEALAGWDSSDPASARVSPGPFDAQLGHSLNGLRVGVANNYFNNESKIQPAVLTAFEEALEQLVGLGAERVQVDIDSVELSAAAQLGILFPEASAFHQEPLRSMAALYGDDVRPFLELGEVPSATHYINANRLRARVAEGFRRCFDEGGIDVLVTPTLPLTAPAAGQTLVEYSDGIQESVMEPLLLWCAPANLTGQPVLSVPCGFDSTPLPIGMSIVGRPFGEATVLRVGAGFQAATDWHRARPPLDLRATG